VPNVVKMNWARESGIWVPHRMATVIHGDGHDINGFADIIVVNYEVLDRHVGWLKNHGFQGMVVDEAHFIKNLSSQRSKHVLELSRSIRSRKPNALFMALTGTPLINDIDDFRAIWQLLGWIDDKKPLPHLMRDLEGIGLTPAEPGFFAAARQAVIDQGIVRRRKEDVASDLPSRRIADLPVELDDSAGRSIRAAERELGQRLLDRFKRAKKARQESRVDAAPISDDELMRMVAQWELEESKSAGDGDNVFTMLRTIGKAKAGLAADYTAQLARSAGKVVFFAKHIDVMDTAEQTFEREGLRSISIRGDQTPTQRQAAIDAFVNDPEVAVAVCSLTAAGVGLNLQVASNVVLAELSWTSAEQTQAIDRVHRIGQEQPVIAWRIIAAQTIDSRIAELIDSKAGLAARALDGDDSEIVDATSLQVDALVHLLKQALHRR
ncbi:MAG: DEAD/DEAH box helicase, partial [Microbacteriaceae bacterium]